MNLCQGVYMSATGRPIQCTGIVMVLLPRIERPPTGAEQIFQSGNISCCEKIGFLFFGLHRKTYCVHVHVWYCLLWEAIDIIDFLE